MSLFIYELLSLQQLFLLYVIEEALKKQFYVW